MKNTVNCWFEKKINLVTLDMYLKMISQVYIDFTANTVEPGYKEIGYNKTLL